MSYGLFKVGKRGIWHYRFQLGGLSTQRSTRETKKGKADIVAERAYEEAKFAARGAQLAPTLADLAGRWLEIHGTVASASHIRSVDTFARLHLYGLGPRLVCDITTEMVELARNEHLVTHAPASANHWLRVLKLLMLWAVKRGMLQAMPWHVKMLKVQKRPRSTLPASMARQWLGNLDAATWRDPAVGTAVRLMLGLGLRELEAAGARWEWLDWDRRVYTPGKTKGREAEPVPTPDWVLEHLRALAPAAHGLIAPSRRGSAHRSGFARTAISLANKACGVEGITPHRLRGTFATMLSEEGVGVQTIQLVMRHKDPKTTMAYLEKNIDIAVAAQSKMAEKMGLGLRENCEVPPAKPHKSSFP
ncbi:tyrosine-type recombinase/integrase [Rugamonas rubra]|uniref:Phage integrase family protein n=1 Tax=Rugamonas rubra TaxID=758825 RepID=A0A1I4SJG1_9BURK|nr:site-specific integrase [Rugamonas rubra]SFM64658.1 Phage integrase family protein [Rugamonas rubra]